MNQEIVLTTDFLNQERKVHMTDLDPSKVIENRMKGLGPKLTWTGTPQKESHMVCKGEDQMGDPFLMKLKNCPLDTQNKKLAYMKDIMKGSDKILMAVLCNQVKVLKVDQWREALQVVPDKCYVVQLVESPDGTLGQLHKVLLKRNHLESLMDKTHGREFIKMMIVFEDQEEIS